MPPTISVVLPTYNAAAFVGEALASVLAQTHRPVEVICVDDGSTDDTLAVLHGIADEAGGLVRVIAQPNGGAPAARNRGLAEATGEYVQFMDADDLLLPTKLEHQAALVAQASERPDLLVAPCIIRERGGADKYVKGARADDPWVGLLSSSLGNTISNLWRREAVVAVGGWDPAQKSSQEVDLMFRLLRNGASVLGDDQALAAALQGVPGDVSVSRADPAASQRRWLLIRERIVGHLQDQGLMTDDRQRVSDYESFKRLRWLFPRDPAFAVDMHGKIVSRQFDPAVFKSRGAYRVLYRTVGFRYAERFRLWKRTVTDPDDIA